MNFVSDGWMPTGVLRWAAPEGTHDPSDTKLQQLWAKAEGQRIVEWRDVPVEVVPKGEMG